MSRDAGAGGDRRVKGLHDFYLMNFANFLPQHLTHANGSDKPKPNRTCLRRTQCANNCLNSSDSDDLQLAKRPRNWMSSLVETKIPNRLSVIWVFRRLWGRYKCVDMWGRITLAGGYGNSNSSGRGLRFLIPGPSFRGAIKKYSIDLHTEQA